MRKVLNKRHVGLICILIAMMLTGYLAVTFMQREAMAKEAATEKFVALTEEKYSFTNNYNVNGIDVLEEYEKQYFGANVEVTAVTNQVFLRVNGNDDIIKILPEEILKNARTNFPYWEEMGIFCGLLLSI